MENMEYGYTLPELEYKYSALAPVISEEQMRLHHMKHHKAYVDNANAIIKKLQVAREENADIDMKATLKELSFNIGGHILHSKFWKNLTPPNGVEYAPSRELMDIINRDFKSFDRFKREFTKAAQDVEGGGWAALAYCSQLDRLVMMQIEKHNVNVIPGFRVLLVADVWEHAYYVDYRNQRAKYLENFWRIVNWKAVKARLDKIISKEAAEPAGKML